jgi:hypothetical protein
MDLAEWVRVSGRSVKVCQGGQEEQPPVGMLFATVGKQEAGGLGGDGNEVGDGWVGIVLEACVKHLGEVECLSVVEPSAVAVSHQNPQKHADHVLAGMEVRKVQIRFGGRGKDTMEKLQAHGFPHAKDAVKVDEAAEFSAEHMGLIKSFHYAIKIGRDRKGRLGCDVRFQLGPVVTGEV